MINRTYYCRICNNKKDTQGIDAPVPICCGEEMLRDYQKINLNMANGTKKEWH